MSSTPPQRLCASREGQCSSLWRKCWAGLFTVFKIQCVTVSFCMRNVFIAHRGSLLSEVFIQCLNNYAWTLGHTFNSFSQLIALTLVIPLVLFPASSESQKPLHRSQHTYMLNKDDGLILYQYVSMLMSKHHRLTGSELHGNSTSIMLSNNIQFDSWTGISYMSQTV